MQISLHHKAVVSSSLTPRRRVASSANFTMPKVSSSYDVAIEYWQGAITWYYQLSQLDQGFFFRGVTPLSLTTLSWLVTGVAWLPNIGPRLAGF